MSAAAGGGDHDLEATRIGSVERKYTAVRRAQQAAARRAWLVSAKDFRKITKRLMRTCDEDTQHRVNDVLSQLTPARNAVRRITG